MPSAQSASLATLLVISVAPALAAQSAYREPPPVIAAILDAIAAHWSVAPDAEITMEANPGTFEQARFEGYRKAGVNRLSIGVQTGPPIGAQKGPPC